MTLMEIMETAIPEEDFYSARNPLRSINHPIHNWSSLRNRLMKALSEAAVFKQFPYLWRKNWNVESSVVDLYDFMVYDACLNVETTGYDFMVYHACLNVETTGKYAFMPYRSVAVDKNELLYQLLHDAAAGLLEVKVEYLEVEESDDFNNHGRYHIVVGEREDG